MFTSTKMGVPALLLSFYTDARSERLFHEQRKLANKAKSYIYAHPALVGLGNDPLVAHLAASAGFSPVDLVVIKVLAHGRPVTAIAVPTRLWRNQDDRARLLSIKHEARAQGSLCILVPQRWLRADTRSAVSRVIPGSPD